MRNLANDMGGKCLTNKYINSTYKMRWKCKNGHSWLATPLEVMGKKNTVGKWCPECEKEDKDNNLKLSLDIDNMLD